VKLVDKSKRMRSVENLVQDLRIELSQVAGITISHIGQLDAVGGNKQIEFSIQGSDINTLQKISNELSDQLRAIPGLVDLDSSLKPNNPTVNIELGSQILSDIGLPVSALTNHLRTLIGGTEIGNWQSPDNQTYKIIAKLPERYVQNSEQLKSLPIILPNDKLGNSQVSTLSQVANIKEEFSPNQINRRNLAREVLFSANTSGRPQGQVSADIDKILKSIHLPVGYRYEFIGSVKNMKESIQYALISLTLAILFIYMTLASQFVSFLQPITIMTSLPLTLIGVVLALLLFGSTVSIFSMIGIILLMGLVTKNAILLIDFAIRLSKENVSTLEESGLSYRRLRHTTLIQAAKVRLRPILMTSLAMIFGMVPLAVSFSEGAEQRAPMGQAVIGGVLTSSILTLVVVPVVYTCFDDLKLWLKTFIHKTVAPSVMPPQ
ncbi:MAG: efflux RND transporter permease subunit, partial [Gammaproteobacteria bacterium]|nr:efflux RND transporter permease subunit [Gammaproteobacteria bacterium]